MGGWVEDTLDGVMLAIVLVAALLATGDLIWIVRGGGPVAGVALALSVGAALLAFFAYSRRYR